MVITRTAAKRITGLILLAGLAAAVVIYLRADPEPDPYALGYDPLTNKKFVRELRVYGGRANVMAAELMQWFDGLWHGRNLAYTVAVLTAVVAWLFWFVATHPDYLREEEGAEKEK